MWHTTNEGMELAKKIEGLFKQRCAEFKEKYHLNFGVYYTPAENLCYTSLEKFKKVYGVIPNISDREYFTNSIHVPVWKQISPFDKKGAASFPEYGSITNIIYYTVPDSIFSPVVVKSCAISSGSGKCASSSAVHKGYLPKH